MKKLLALFAAGLMLAGCSSTPAGTGSPAGGSPGSATGTVTVFAAASLTETFNELGRRFEADHPGTRVVFNFGGSSALATQINNGAPVDVFASASTASMDEVVNKGAAESPAVFATNHLMIAVPSANPAGISTLADLAKPEVKVVLCQPAVPCGALADKVLAKAKLTVRPVSLEPDVKAALTKVSLGEADAALVYATDVLASAKTVKGIEIPADVNGSTSYPIATLKSSANPELAAAFVALVRSPAGQQVLADAGFAKP